MIYTAYFGFNEQPFSITPNPRFFYANPGHEEVYAALLYGIRERKGCIVLIGEAGTGKTTMLRRVMNDVERTVRTAYFYTTTLSFDELLDSICADFDLPIKGERRLEKIQALNAFLLQVLQEGGTGALIIDEAQNLDHEVLENLRLLSNFETATEKLLQIILVGQPELEQKLERPELRQLKQRIAVRCRLDRLRAEEVGAFIYHRLRVAGCNRDDVFTPAAVRRVVLYSDGIPRIINTICDNALLIAYGAGQQSVSEAAIEEVARDLRLTEAPWKTWSPSRAATNTLEETRPPRVGVATLQQNPGEERLQAWTPAPARSWPKRLAWTGVAIALLFLLWGGSGLIAPSLTRARLASFNMGAARAPAPAERETLTTPAEILPERTLPEPTPIASTPSSHQVLDQQIAAPEDRTSEPSPPVQPSVEEEGEKPGESITIARGDTISGLVLKVYGQYNVLAFDLIGEFNPQLADLDRITVGEKIWLPFLTREALLRQQADGSYRLIVGAFHSDGEAQRVARRVRREGYTVTVTPRTMSGTRTLHRVQLENLQDRATVDRAWSLVVKGRT